MQGAGKGLGLLVAAFVVIGGGAWWFLRDDATAKLDRSGANGVRAASGATEDELASPATAAPQPEAERAMEVDPAAAAPNATESAANFPLAEHLSGIVVDPNGRPIANAEVSFGPPEGFNFGRRGRGILLAGGSVSLPSPVTTRTDREGLFRLAKVPRNEGLGLRVDHPDYVIYRRDDLIVPSNGMELGRIALKPGASVSGHVFAPDGAKLAGVEVSMREAPDDAHPYTFSGFDFGTRGGRKAVTEADGRFRLTGMPEGKALVVANLDGWCEATSQPVTLVPLQEVGGIVLRLERGHTIQGIVRDGAGKPVANANVTASSSDFAPLRFVKAMRGEPDAVSGADGRFKLTGLKAGVYEVGAEAEGFAPKSVAGIDAATAGPVEITLGTSSHVAGRLRIKGSGELARDVKVQLLHYWGEEQAMPPFETPDSENVTTEDGGFLIADVDPGRYRVSARGEGTTRGLSAPITVEDGASVDGIEIEVERGAVLAGRVVDVATGAPIANADVAGFTPNEPAPARPGVGVARRISVGARIGGGRFNFDPQRRNVGRTKTDAEGRFELQHLSAGNYVLDVSHAEYATARSEPLEVAAAQTRSDADLRLGRGGVVEGSVLGIDGKPRAGDRIDVESKSVTGVTCSAVSDANGWYRIEHVPAGDALATRSESDDGSSSGPIFFGAIAIEGDGAAEPEKGKRIAVEEGKTLRVDFSQIEKPYVEGVVSSADGPVAGAIVTATTGGGDGHGAAMPFVFGPQKKATTGPDGRFRLADLDPGNWRLSARHPQGIVPTTAKVTLEAGAPARQDFVLEGGVIEGDVTALKGGARLEGAIVNLERVRQAEAEADAEPEVTGEFVVAIAPGRRLGGGTQSFRLGGDSGATVSSDREGHYRVPWVPAGKYRVSVTRDGYLLARSDEIEVKLNAHVDKVDLALPPAAGLVVKLRSKATGEPLANCPVQLENSEGSNEFGMTDAEGIARFDSLQPGEWTVTGKKSFQDAGSPQQTVMCEAERAPEITIDM